METKPMNKFYGFGWVRAKNGVPANVYTVFSTAKECTIASSKISKEDGWAIEPVRITMEILDIYSMPKDATPVGGATLIKNENST